MIGEGKKKMCVTKDASQSTEAGSFSCSTCGAHSDDKSVLCDPVEDS
ncbi:MAG TPA: hypothetical protein VMJ66_09105 [Geobacteraceae bacterium]|nr:hypothetical protein [Geobacteraceae bacterium]